MNIKYLPALVVICMVAFLGSCANLDMQSISSVQSGPVETATYFDPQDLEPSITQAMFAVEMAKANNLAALPYIAVSTSAEIDVFNYPQGAAFLPRKQIITEYSSTPDGVVTLEFFSESDDQAGRRDITVNKVIYSTRKPDKKEQAAIRQWTLKTGKEFFKKSADARKDLTQLQKEKGLVADGAFGKKSAAAISEEISMVEIQKIESSIFHPETPSHMMFILPYDVVSKNIDKFNKGFASLIETGKQGLTVEQFAARAKAGDKFVVFVYFFDRIDPKAGIKIGFSASDQPWSSVQSEAYYATPGTWLVVSETFSVDDTLDANGLAANVLIKSGFVYKTIGSIVLKEKMVAAKK
jgi:hypothetical protein